MLFIKPAASFVVLFVQRVNVRATDWPNYNLHAIEHKINDRSLQVSQERKNNYDVRVAGKR